jgi:hypothetical protein
VDGLAGGHDGEAGSEDDHDGPKELRGGAAVDLADRLEPCLKRLAPRGLDAELALQPVHPPHVALLRRHGAHEDGVRPAGVQDVAHGVDRSSRLLSSRSRSP